MRKKKVTKTGKLDLSVQKNREPSTSRRAVKPARTPNLYPLEEQEQAYLAGWLNVRFGYYGWIHIPNEQMGGPGYVGKLIKMGLKTGFPDILIFHPIYETEDDGSYVGMAIELKRQKAAKPKVTPNQKLWLLELQNFYWKTCIAYGAQDAIDKIVKVYGVGRR